MDWNYQLFFKERNKEKEETERKILELAERKR
jgi:hypothetical protein